MTAIKEQFPRLPATRAHFYVRLVVIGCFLVLLLVLGFVRPLEKAASICSLLLQLGSAALLWWESTAALERIDLITDELELQDKRIFPFTKMERLINFTNIFTSYAVLFAAIFLVAAKIFLQTPSGQVKNLVMAELSWLAVGIALFIISHYVGKLAQKFFESYAFQINCAKGQTSERRELTRRSVRSIAFAVFFIGLLIQIVLASLV